MSPALAVALLVTGTVAVLGAALVPRPVSRPVTAPRRRRRRPWVVVRRRPRPPGDVEVAAWCERLARAARSGRSLTQAIAVADGDTRPDDRPFPRLGHDLARGRSLADALADDDADPRTAAGLVSPVLRTCAELGGTPAGPVERVAAVLAAREVEAAERRAATAQARLSANVLTAVPVGVVALLAITEPAIRTTLTTAPGLTCLAAGATLNLAGRAWMHQQIRGST